MEDHVLDLTLTAMEETRIMKKFSNLMKEYTRRYHFNEKEVEILLVVFYKIKKMEPNVPGFKISKRRFFEILHNGLNMTNNRLMEKIFTAIETSTTQGHLVNLNTWFKTLSLFLRGTLEERIKHCFAVYSSTSQGAIIGREQIFFLMRKCLISSGSDDDVEESIKDLIEVIIKKMDLDRDGKISFDDYRKSVLKDPLLLECFGECLPSRSAVITFISTIFPYNGKI